MTSPHAGLRPLSLAVRDITPVASRSLTPAESLWFNRLLAGMSASQTLLNNTMTSNDLYSIGRDGGNYIEALLMALRATGDFRLLDRVLELTDLAKASLQDAWLDGTTDGFTDWLWLIDPANTEFYGKDTNWLDEAITSGNVALWTYAFHANRNVAPRYAAAADFWRGWLENQFLAKWYQRVGGDPLVAWNTPYAAFYKPGTETRSANWRLAHYLWKVTGNPFYRDRTNEIVDELIGAQEINPSHPTAYRWAKETDPSTQNWQAINYANYYMRVVMEMSLEGMPSFSSDTEMRRFASTFRDVVYASSLPGLTTMTSDVSGGGSVGYALYAFNGLAAWDSSGVLMTLANRSITGAGNYASGGLSKAARNDVFISAYALMSLSVVALTPTLIAAFDAVPLEDGTVRVAWELSLTSGAVATNLYRIGPDGVTRTRVNDAPVAGPGAHVLIDAPPADAEALIYELAELTDTGEQVLGRIEVTRTTTGRPRFVLDQNAPNPFTSSTLIRFEVPEAAPVRVAIYDPTGRLVRMIQDGDMPAGRYSRRWDGRDARGEAMPSGIYFTIAESGRQRAVRKAIRVH